jgi:hypothetical protein
LTFGKDRVGTEMGIFFEVEGKSKELVIISR